MTLAAQYAKALYISEGPEKARLAGLRTALERRGHERLLPSIFGEYERLVERDRRLTKYKETSPEQEQTRILLELYKKLVDTHG